VAGTPMLFVVLAMVIEIKRGWNFVSLSWGDGKCRNEDPFPGYQY